MTVSSNNADTPKDTQAFIQKIIDLCDEKKATDIRVYHLNDRSVTDYVIFMSANNQIHVNALSEAIHQSVKQFPNIQSQEVALPGRLAGSAQSGWMVLDFNSLMVHILTEDIRDFYELDHLYEKKGIVYHS